MHGMRAWVQFIAAYFRANLQAAMEYRVSFLSQVVAMFINDAMWLVFWLAYFDKFRVVEGWGRSEIVMLWAVVAAGFGLATTLCGNVFQLTRLIVRGELDVYLALPKPVLPHMLISRMNPTAPGDIVFGLLGFALIVHPTPGQWALFGVFTISTAAIFVAFGVATQSLAFWLGNAEGLSQQLMNALISFSTYPTVIFHGAVKLALFTVVPAGFIGYLPVVVMKEFSLVYLLAVLAFAAGAVLSAHSIFQRGLRRYESGNLILIRQ